LLPATQLIECRTAVFTGLLGKPSTRPAAASTGDPALSSGLPAATAGADYNAINGTTVTIPANTASVQVTVTVSADTSTTVTTRAPCPSGERA